MQFDDDRDPGPEFDDLAPARCQECGCNAPAHELDGMYLCQECYEEPSGPADWEVAERGDLADGTSFADPGGVSALRAATADNPRNLPCPTCGEPNRLTPADRRCGYQCDACADACELGY